MTQPANPPVVADPKALLLRLRELINALDRRVPHLEREGELRIAAEAEALKKSALLRIAEIDRRAGTPRP